MTNNHAKVILNALCAGISNLETLEAITMAIKALDEMHQDLITAEEYAFSLKKQLAEKNAEIKTLKTLAKLGNMRANDYRVMRDRALKAESEVERLKEEVSFGQRTCREWAETCDELTEKLNGAIAGQETLQKALAEKNAEIERLKEYEDIRPTGCPNCHRGNFSNSKFCSHCGAQLQGKKKDVRTEAIKECLEWVLSLFPADKKFTTISRFAVKQKLKEMVGDTE